MGFDPRMMMSETDHLLEAEPEAQGAGLGL